MAVVAAVAASSRFHSALRLKVRMAQRSLKSVGQSFVVIGIFGYNTAQRFDRGLPSRSLRGHTRGALAFLLTIFEFLLIIACKTDLKSNRALEAWIWWSL
jgi:hypothetical protein